MYSLPTFIYLRHSVTGLHVSVLNINLVIYCKVIVQLDFFFTCRFKFPSVFIIYQNITVVVYAIFILVGYTAKTPLFCSSDDVTESLDNPTPFCTIIGNS